MSVDEIQYFEASVQQVQSEQNAFYTEMIQIVPPADLAQLDQIIQKAKNYLYAKPEGQKIWLVWVERIGMGLRWFACIYFLLIKYLYFYWISRKKI